MSTRVHSLSQEELQLVLANVPFAERLSHAPCVCKAWRKALAAPSMAWEHCHIRSCELAACIGDTDDSQIRMQKNRILRWAVRRGAAVRCLQVNFKPTEDLESLLQALLPSMSGLLQLGLTGRIGGSLWTLAALTQLRRLTIDVHEPYMNTISQHLQPLTTLTSLDLSRLGSGPLRDNVQGFRALCSLTLLERLWLSRFGLLGRLPGSVSRLTGLVHLHLEECGVQGLPAEISTLRNLRKLALVSNPLEEDTALPASMVECTGLQYLDLSCNDLDRLPQNLHLLTSLCGLEIDYHTMLLADCGLGSLVNLRLLLLDWDVVIEQSLTALGQLQLLVLRAINMSPGDMLQPCTMANLLGLAQCRAAPGQLKLGLMIYPGDTTQFPVQFVEQLLLLNNKPGIEITYASPDWRRTMPCAWTNQFEKELEKLTLATQ